MTQSSFWHDRPAGPEKNRLFLSGTLLVYCTVELIAMFLHPMWRDEIHPFAMAGAGGTLGNLLRLKAVEGHPDLWYILVYTLRIFTANPLAVQLFHSAIAITTAFLVIRYAPFSRLQRLLMVMGYFYLFEYAVISRNYAIGILGMVLLLILYPQRLKRPLLPACILFLMMQASVYGLIMAGAFILTWSSEVCFSAGSREEMRRNRAGHILALIVILAGFALSVASIIPPKNGFFAGSAEFDLRDLTLRKLIRSVGMIWNAWIPIPATLPHFWNTNLAGPAILRCLLALAIVIPASLLLARRPRALLLFLSGTIGILLFVNLFYFGYLRHHGHHFILFTASMWLYRLVPERQSPPGKLFTWLHLTPERLINLFFTFFLTVQTVGGLFAVAVQSVTPFSASRQTACFIREHHLDRFTIAGDQDICLEPVAGYLNRDLFFLSRSQAGSFLQYDSRRKRPENYNPLAIVDSLSRSTGDTLLLIMNYPLIRVTWDLVPVKQFTRTVLEDESCYLYLLPPR
ncbi:MAG TPA: hypothetical protein PLK82_08060 [Bacteroidales bacterium]|nr:hypothetical protein [Bacteroidales bacterium]